MSVRKWLLQMLCEHRHRTQARIEYQEDAFGRPKAVVSFCSKCKCCDKVLEPPPSVPQLEATRFLYGESGGPG